MWEIYVSWINVYRKACLQCGAIRRNSEIKCCSIVRLLCGVLSNFLSGVQIYDMASCNGILKSPATNIIWLLGMYRMPSARRSQTRWRSMRRSCLARADVHAYWYTQKNHKSCACSSVDIRVCQELEHENPPTQDWWWLCESSTIEMFWNVHCGCRSIVACARLHHCIHSSGCNPLLAFQLNTWRAGWETGIVLVGGILRRNGSA